MGLVPCYSRMGIGPLLYNMGCVKETDGCDDKYDEDNSQMESLDSQCAHFRGICVGIFSTVVGCPGPILYMGEQGGFNFDFGKRA